MTRAGYKLTRFADDWVVACKTRKEAKEKQLTVVVETKTVKGLVKSISRIKEFGYSL